MALDCSYGLLVQAAKLMMLQHRAELPARAGDKSRSGSTSFGDPFEARLGQCRVVARLQDHRSIQTRRVEVQLVVRQECGVDDQLQLRMEGEGEDRAGHAPCEPFGDAG